MSGCDEPKGKFYSLEKSYENGWLTKEDLINIAFYYNDEKYDDGFVPTPKNPETISKSTENDIKYVYLKSLKEEYPDATIKDIYIQKYYGTYGDCIVVNVWDNCLDYDLKFNSEHFIGSILFKDYCDRFIYVYKLT